MVAANIQAADSHRVAWREDDSRPCLSGAGWTSHGHRQRWQALVDPRPSRKRPSPFCLLSSPLGGEIVRRTICGGAAHGYGKGWGGGIEIDEGPRGGYACAGQRELGSAWHAGRGDSAGRGDLLARPPSHSCCTCQVGESKPEGVTHA